MINGLAKQRWIPFFFFAALGLRAADQPTLTITVPAASVDHPYRYQIGATAWDDAPVTFKEIAGGNSDWLRVSPSGLLEGTPDKSAPARSTITVRAETPEGVQATATLVVTVESMVCPRPAAGEIAWCEPAQNPAPPGAASGGKPSRSQPPTTPSNFQLRDQFQPITQFTKAQAIETPQIVQFRRNVGDYGMFGHWDRNQKKLVIDTSAVNGNQEWINAVNGSNVLISGSILIETEIPHCSRQEWRVVTETTDSSNVLIYGPNEASIFCQPDAYDPHKSTVYIVIPSHAIWANVFYNEANTLDPSWKSTVDAPLPHKCNGDPAPAHAASVPVTPPQGIRPCDSNTNASIGSQSHFLTSLYYSPWIAPFFTHFTQPGVTQGAISIAPWDLKTKETWDVQGYVSTRVPGGWFGFNATVEHDRTPQDDLNSITGGVTYDWRWGDTAKFWGSKWKPGTTTPPFLGLRVPDFNARFGPEFQPEATGLGKANVNSYGRALNFVGGVTARLPIVLNFFHDPSIHQPSAVTILPLVGWEGGGRYDPAVIMQGVNPQLINRLVYGADGSLRWPFQLTHNFLGNRPITVDYSYRVRRLLLDEPFILANSSPTETFGGGERTYEKLTLIMPLSAYLQLRAAWQHGTLPPVFQYAANVFTLGVTFSNPGSVEH